MSNPNLKSLNEKRMAAAANGHGYTFRRLHIAWCLLRGCTMDQIESPYSNPHTIPNTTTILRYAKEGYRPRVEGQDETEHASERDAYLKSLEEHIRAWEKSLYPAWLVREAERRARRARRQMKAAS